MKVRYSLCLMLAVTVVIFSAAQETKKEVKHAPAPPTSAASGKKMFTSYCASCHG